MKVKTVTDAVELVTREIKDAKREAVAAFAVSNAVANFVPEYATLTDDDDDADGGYKEVFRRDGPHAQRPPSFGGTVDMLEDDNPEWVPPEERRTDAEQKTLSAENANETFIDKLRKTMIGRRYYHFRYPLVIVTVLLQIAFIVVGTVSKIGFEDSRITSNETGIAAFIYAGRHGDNTSIQWRDGQAYQSWAGHWPLLIQVTCAICVVQACIDIFCLCHIIMFVRRISLRVAFIMLISFILSFAFYYCTMDIFLRFNQNTSAFSDLKDNNPCNNNEYFLPFYVRYLYFSVASVTSTGFGDVTPDLLITRAVATVEMFLGTLW